METPELNIEEQLKCYRLLLEGKHDQVECRYLTWGKDEPWLTVEPNMAVRVPGTDEEPTQFRFRLKPQPKYRPWKVEEVPVGAIMKAHQASTGPALITDVFRGKIRFGRDGEVTLEYALTGAYEYSLDQGKTWQPCGVLSND